MRPSVLSLALCSAAGLAAPAAGQTYATLAQESFDYPVLSALGGLDGGAGFLVPWWSGGAGMDAVISAPGLDLVGWLASTTPQTISPQEIKSESYRRLDGAGWGAISVPSDSPSGFEYGADGAIFWFSYTTKRVQGGDDTWGGFSLFTHFGSNGGEKLFIGAPFQFNEIGIDDQAGAVLTVFGSNVDVATRVVTRVDFQPGAERVRMWLDPLVEHPLSTPDLDMTVPDFSFNEIRIGSGDGGTIGSAGGWEFDDLRIECQDCVPPPPIDFSGAPASISVVGGGTQSLSLDAGVANAGLFYIIVGSLSGTTPGFLLDGLNLPINIDAYSLVTLSNANSALFQNTFGALDGSGQAAAAIQIPANTSSSLVGLQMNHAYAVLQVTPSLLKGVFTSSAVSLDLTN